MPRPERAILFVLTFCALAILYIGQCGTFAPVQYATPLRCTRPSSTNRFGALHHHDEPLFDAFPVRSTFATFISTTSFLPGVHALICSLRKVRTAFPMLVLATQNVHADVVAYMREHNLQARRKPHRRYSRRPGERHGSGATPRAEGHRPEALRR